MAQSRSSALECVVGLGRLSESSALSGRTQDRSEPSQ